MTFEDFKHLCEQRRSTREFAEKPVSKEIVFHLIDAAMLAPNVLNIQPWHFHIIENKSLQKTLMESSCYGNFILGAGIFVVVTCDVSLEPEDKTIVWNPKELEYSCMTAVEHMLLGATAMGLSSCFISLYHGTAHEALKLPKEQIIIGGIMIGHPLAPTEEAADRHMRKERRDFFTIY